MSGPLTDKQIVALSKRMIHAYDEARPFKVEQEIIAAYREAHAAVPDPLADIPEPMRAPVIAEAQAYLAYRRAIVKAESILRTAAVHEAVLTAERASDDAWEARYDAIIAVVEAERGTR